MAARQAEFPLEPCPSHSHCVGYPSHGNGCGTDSRDGAQGQPRAATNCSSKAPLILLTPQALPLGLHLVVAQPPELSPGIRISLLGAVPPPRTLHQLNNLYHLGTNCPPNTAHLFPHGHWEPPSGACQPQQPHCQGFSCQHTFPRAGTCDLFNCTQESCLGSRLTGTISATVRGTREL